MVGLYLEAKRKGGEYGTDKGNLPGVQSLAVRVDYSGKHPGSPGQGQHLGIVAYLDNLQVIGAEGYRNCSGCGQKRAYPKGQHKQEGPKQGNEKVAGWALSYKEGVKEALGGITPVISRKHSGWHTPEHRVCPGRFVVRVLCVPGVGLVGHTDVTGDIALVNYLSAKHLRHKAVGYYKKSRNYSGVKKYFLLKVFHIRIKLCCPAERPYSLPSGGVNTFLCFRRRIARRFQDCTLRGGRLPRPFL